MPLQPSPLLRGFEQGADGEDVWNRMMPGEERGPLALDPQAVALGQQFQTIKAGIEAQQAQQAQPIWNPNNPVGTETVQSMGMPRPTIYAGRVGEFIDPATGQLTDKGKASLDNPMLGFDTGGLSGGGLLGSLKAYHGSPHAFDAFSDHAIGTGEGAQAYGYGHYLAENEGVARGYRDALTNKHQPPDLVATQDALLQEIGASNDKAAALTAKGFDYDSPEVRAAIDPHEQNIKALQDKLSAMPKPTGHMYEVNVAADPEKFLHWDKPLSEQHPDVQDALRKLGFDPSEAGATGQHVVKTLENEARYDHPAYQPGGGNLPPADWRPDPGAASQRMAEAGIPGIRYLDQGSRHLPDPTITPLGSNAGGRSYWQVGSGPSKRLFRSEAAANDYVANAPAPTHNVVVFDPKNLEVIRRYGLAGLMGGGAAALAGGGNQEQ